MFPDRVQTAFCIGLYFSALVECNPVPQAITRERVKSSSYIRTRQIDPLCVNDDVYRALSQPSSNSSLSCSPFLVDPPVPSDLPELPAMPELDIASNADTANIVRQPGLVTVTSTVTVALTTVTSVEIKYQTATLTFNLIDRPGPATSIPTSTTIGSSSSSPSQSLTPKPTPAPGVRHGGRIRRGSNMYLNSTDLSGFAAEEISSACNCLASSIPAIDQQFVLLTVTVPETTVTVEYIEWATGRPVIVYETIGI